ncbi:amino acid adenylation domain-containing protein [Saccharothrix ecbatanensis]|uniref:Amino acid adenylation domain-containing protein n=1 Tax=Saccharothrix ecbatanensis TaxID=1105145 RepID=A0A7W9LY24_9PSEU|nr:non-ribosomal peptide synthetase [Saccharothrix ecbatanensis]MBB5800336.1 amino acid adenylation domain-containing protein [Saccharothrix ecbatanensis]
MTIVTESKNLLQGSALGRLDIETVHGLFRWCAQRWPSAVAIVAGDRQVTYRELQLLADDYAVELANKGVRRGDLVPVLMPRTPEFIAALLAVLECGAAYAALDVRWPQERLTSLITALDAKVLVTAAEGAWPVPVAAPPSTESATGRRPHRIELRGDEPCAVFFTSGSTGTPKATVTPHSGMVRLFADCDFADFGPGNVVPQLAPVSWDGFCLDGWGVLLNGGTSVFLDDPVLVPSTLRRLVSEHGVNGVFLTTTLLNMIIDEDVDAFAGVRWLLTGGERASAAHMGRLVRRFPAIELNNMYGPVESTSVVTARRVTVEDCVDPGGVPLGRVLNGTQIFVLDGDRPCGPGETGELCIAGSGLAFGYIGDPELTAEKFPDITVDGQTHRVYRTGDLGHYSTDDVLYFDGRLDRQVKIRGHRIEPAEIEFAAARIAGVTAAVVVPIADPEGRGRSLCLCYSGSGDDVPDERAVRAELAERLPAYLVPDRIRLLAEMPLFSNGKVNQRALEQIATEEDHADDHLPDAQPLLDPVEARLAAVFGQILQRGFVPPDSSFFELGANSLDAARLCAKVEAEFGVAVPVSQVFATSTVRELAASLKPRLDDVVPADVPDATTEAGVRSVELPVHYALALWEGMSEASDLAYLCTMAWWIDGAPDVDALSRAILDVHHRHEALHSRYVMDPGPIAMPSDDVPGPDLTLLPDAPTEDAALAALHAELYRPLSIAEGKIWRCALVRSADSGRLAFGLTAHHVAFDGASQEPMAADLGTAYQARLRGEAPVFAEPAETLAEIADTYRRRRAAADLDAQIDYWNKELDGLPQITLPGRLSAETIDGPRVTVARHVSAQEMEPWDEAARELGSTRLVALSVAYGSVLRRLSGQDDFGILVPFSSWIGDPGRSISTRMDMLCLRMRPASAGSDMWDNVGKAVGAALVAQDVSFVEAAMPVITAIGDDAMGRLPVLLVENLADPELTLPSCRTEFAHLGAPTTMSELETEVWYAPDGGVRLNVAVWTDYLPVEFATEFAEEFQRVLCAGPAALAAPADAP